MDRSKWEYKKLKDICVSIDDGDWIESQDQSSEGIRLIQTGNIGVGEYLDKSDKSKYISEETFSRLKCKEIFGGDCLISRLPDPIGRACILPMMSDRMITAVDCSIVRFKENVVPGYFVHYTKSRKYNSDISKFATGATRKRISRKNLEGIVIPMPSSELQKQIVAELDCLNEMIAVKQEQLKEFDKLAQSIFYDMFGDPITKNKKWETIKLEKITIAEGGGTPSKNIPDYWNGDVVWVTSKDMKQMYISDSQIHITEDGLNNSPAHILPKGTILLVNRSGILKHTLPLAITTKEVSINQDLKALTIKDERFISIYVLYTLKAFAPYLLSKVKAVTVDSIEFSIFKKLDIPLSSLTLQQQFAEKISAIEAQKELVKASIAETQQLLDSRMDYYFD